MICPPPLCHGDTIRLIAPSGPIDHGLITNAKKLLSTLGYKVTLGKHIWNKVDYLSGTDQERREDFQTALSDPEVAAIWALRGGYGLGRIIDSLDFSPLKQHPKWLIGYSDFTLAHLAASKHGLSSLHALMPKEMEQPEQEDLKATLHFLHSPSSFSFSSKCSSQDFKFKGKVVGGNLALVCDSLGTDHEIETNGHLLFLEDVNEPIYKIDRMFHQLKRAKKFSGCSGIMLGYFTDCGEEATQHVVHIAQQILEPLGVPIVHTFPAGHEKPNFPLPLNFNLELEVKEGILRIGARDTEILP